MFTILLLLIIASPFILFKYRNTKQGQAVIIKIVMPLLKTIYQKSIEKK